MEKKDLKNIKMMDWWLLGAVLLLCLYGLLGIGSANVKPVDQYAPFWERAASLFSMTYVQLQFVSLLLGIGVCALTVLIDYTFYRDISLLLYIATIVLLVLVLIFGSTNQGTKGWFELGTRTFQPSEIGKIGMILWLARVITKSEQGASNWKTVGLVSLYFLIPFVLIALQPDYGTGLVYVAIVLAMLFIGGIQTKQFLTLLGSGLAVIPLVWFVLFNDARRARLLVFLDPSLDPTGTGYQVMQSRIAIGSGRLLGKGIFDAGAIGQLGYVPVKHSDFIFAIIGETFGFIGCIALLVLLGFFMFRLIRDAMQTKDRYGALVTVGVAAMMFFHIFENIGMSLGVMPVTGIPLPFVSYGGSNMISNFIAIGVVLNISWRRYRYRFDTKGRMYDEHSVNRS